MARDVASLFEEFWLAVAQWFTQLRSWCSWARGKAFSNASSNGSRGTGISDHYRKLDSDETFCDLCRTFETVTGESIDQVVVSAIMGHTPSKSNMSARYRQRVSDERLPADMEHVHQWWKGGVK